jgi:hypothetical protein
MDRHFLQKGLVKKIMSHFAGWLYIPFAASHYS